MDVRVTIIRGARLFAPEDLGIQDLCILDSRIAAIAPSLPELPVVSLTRYRTALDV